MTDGFAELRLAERNRLALRWTPKGVPTLLDAGCAWGYATRFFAGRAERVAGIDVDERAIAIARARYPAIDFRVAPLEAVPYPDEAFTVVLCLDVLEHVRDERESLDELFRVLQPGGTLILSTPHQGVFSFLDPINVVSRLRHFAEEPEHRHYSIDDLRRLLNASRWAGNYEVLRMRRAGLLVYPLVLWAQWLTSNPRMPGALERLASLASYAIELDYLIPWGALSYTIALKIRKQTSSI